ncbi:TPA: conjugal transfer protein TraN [Vibrio cholerae]|uniref:conjugal transfer protein TraN n=1 Tax=Vibrio cholerae TaxID=666 RepID=UPI000E0B0AC9|nr:conjugal transfer protein TraN [Vibrio cholerae]MCX9672159.1 conjugal transfer protein TraN [Vibrio cholerae]MCX9680805.1 conjugal transfer protein TraN [Vibrio cholerae]MCX9686822.1 conjugal transfer protein TraN [Vibrio cholerae]MCX9698305.1 conjugal transfer protein TraN [Vibrio cholerae]MCX9716097.1 conjugal transfer protein TraN [Vibrio cholerae]
MKGKFIYLFWLALLVPSLAYSNIFDQSNPARWVCGSDLNGNGYLGEEGETAACIGNAPSNYCPIGAAVCTQKSESKTTAPSYFCPTGSLVGQQCIYTAEVCEYSFDYSFVNEWRGGGVTKWRGVTVAAIPVTEHSSFHGGAFYRRGNMRVNGGWNKTYEVCREGSNSYDATPSCPSGYVFNSSSKLCVQNTLVDVCPLGSQYQCVPNGGAKYCSPNKCVDKKDPANEEAKDVDGNMLVDDGKRNDQGLCLDQVYIYNGRGQRCLKSGIETAFQNCCKDKGKVFQDGAGAYSSIGTASQTISGLYSVAEMAYVTYSAQTAAGVSSAFAAELAASAAQQQLLIAFDPTTIAISVAMHFVMEWVMNACDQMDMETAMAHSSGYCVEVGEYCKKKIKFIGCVQKARSFCCFNSKLARIIQEQGRPQLTTVNGFGTPSEPNCRGFTPEEFQRIDFAKIDLGEYIEELQKHTQEQVQQNIQQVTEDFFNKVK